MSFCKRNKGFYLLVRMFVYQGSIYLLLWLTLFLAGLLAAHKTKQVTTGLLAGFWARIIFLLSALVIANDVLGSAKWFPEWYAALHRQYETLHARLFR